MSKTSYTCTGCMPIDKSIVDTYVALLSADKSVEEAEEARVEAEAGRVEAETARVSAEASRVIAEDAREATSSADHTLAASDHTTAEADHATAEGDHTTATSDHTASVEATGAAGVATTRANAAAAAAEHMVDIKTGPQGPQGNTGSSVDYPYELVNNLTTNDATKGLSAAMGKSLNDNKVEAEDIETAIQEVPSNYYTKQETSALIGTSIQSNIVNDVTTGGSTKTLSAEMGKQLAAADATISGQVSQLGQKMQRVASFISQVDTTEDNFEAIDLTGADEHSVLKADGTISQNEGNYSVSPYIPIDQIYNYYFRFGNIFGNTYACIAFYDGAYNCIKSFVDTDDVPTTISKDVWFKLEIPVSVKYIKIQGNGNNIWIKRALKVGSFDDFGYSKKTNDVPGGVNLLNYKKVQKGYIINTNNGNIVSTTSDRYVSDYIYVKGLTTIYFTAINFSSGGTYILYDKDFNKLSYGAGANAGVTIGNAVWIKVGGVGASAPRDMVYCGVKPNVYVPYTMTDLNALYDINNGHYLEQVDTPIKSKLTALPTTFESGIFGESNPDYETSDYIEVSPNINHHYLLFSRTSGNNSKVRFYDKDKNAVLLSEIRWNEINDYVGKIIRVCYPKGCQYVRYCRRVGDVDGLFINPVNNFEDAVKEIVDFNSIAHNSCYADTNNILWVGTSIPEGSTYPQHSCEANGYYCINNSKGQQSLGIRVGNTRCLTWTVDEFKAAFTYTGEAGKIEVTELEYKSALDKTYERAVLPFIKGEQLVISDGSTTAPNGIINPDALKVYAIVVDHGYNDTTSILELMEDPDNIDWNSRDRTNFVGAYNYLIDKIQEINPFIKIIVGGYFENTWVNNGEKKCAIQKLVAEHFHLELFDVWNYSQISTKIVMGTSTYIADFNQTYGKSYVVPASHQDQNGNIMSHNLFCPDDIHPHSDLTGNADKHLDAIYTRFIKGVI